MFKKIVLYLNKFSQNNPNAMKNTKNNLLKLLTNAEDMPLDEFKHQYTKAIAYDLYQKVQRLKKNKGLKV